MMVFWFGEQLQRGAIFFFKTNTCQTRDSPIFYSFLKPSAGDQPSVGGDGDRNDTHTHTQISQVLCLRNP